MPSRFFTLREALHFPKDCSHIEVTEDGRYIHHKDNGEVRVIYRTAAPAPHTS